MRTLVVLVAMLVGACAPQASPSPAPSTPGTSPLTPSAAATTTASPEAIASPTATPSTLPAGGIEAFAIGTLSGDVVLALVEPALQQVPSPIEVGELWAVPLGGGGPRLAARFVSSTRDISGIGSGAGRTTNVLRRQLSPDGGRVLLSVATTRSATAWRLSLVVLELATGRVQMLGSDDQDHDTEGAWSPDGRRIAYVRRPDARAGAAFDDGMWIMNADGTSPRRVEPTSPGSFTHVLDWAPDSRTVTFTHSFEEAPLLSVDVDGGARGRMGFIAGPPHSHSWRAGSPRLVSTFFETPRQSPTYLAVADTVGAPERVLVRQPDPERPLIAARWHPQADTILYVRSWSELFTVDLVGGTPRQVSTPVRAIEAEWVADGRIAYIGSEHPSAILAGTHVRVVTADGTGDLVLLMPRQGMLVADIATRRY